MELLADIQQIFREENKDKLPSKTLVKKLIAMEERPWAEYRRGQAADPEPAGQLFKDFDVHTHQAKVGAKNLKHYLLADLKPLFERYLKMKRSLPPPGNNRYPATSGQKPTS